MELSYFTQAQMTNLFLRDALPSCHRALQHGIWIVLDHPELVAFGRDQYVKAWTVQKRQCARTACLDGITPGPSGWGSRNYSIHADRRRRYRQRTVPVEIYRFKDSFRLRDTRDDVFKEQSSASAMPDVPNIIAAVLNKPKSLILYLPFLWVAVSARGHMSYTLGHRAGLAQCQGPQR